MAKVDSITLARALSNCAMQLENLGEYERGLAFADTAAAILRSRARTDTAAWPGQQPLVPRVIVPSTPGHDTGT